MSVNVTREPGEQWPLENCCMCQQPTQYWYGKGSANVPVCPTCAANVTAEELPTKEEWCKAERRRSKRPSFAAPW